jgi:hypothetical protein
VISRLIEALISCLVVLVVAWIITLVIGFLDLGAISALAEKIVWAVAGLICLILLLRIFSSGTSLFRRHRHD